MPVKFNTAALKAKLQEVAQRVPERVQDALGQVGDQILEDAQSRVPVSTGELRDSGYAQPVEGGVRVGFSAEHATAVHERLDLEHEDGESKFLERAVLAREDQIRTTLAAVIGEALK